MTLNVIQCLLYAPPSLRHSHYAKPEVLPERIKVPIVMQELDVVLHTVSGNDAIHGLPYSDAFCAQCSEVVRCLQCQGNTA
jgi:hypothetical protein